MYIAAPEHSDREIDTWISRQAHNTFWFYILNIVKKAQFIEKKLLIYHIFISFAINNEHNRHSF